MTAQSKILANNVVKKLVFTLALLEQIFIYLVIYFVFVFLKNDQHMAIARFRKKNCATLILKINCIKITRIRASRKFS